MIEVAPSLLAADILNLGQEVRRVLDQGADVLHLDIMDGHFVPNLSFSPSLVKALSHAFPQATLDVHLMLSKPEDYIAAFAEAGAHEITLHQEADLNIETALKRIRALGIKAGLSVKPNTPVENLIPYLPLCDLVLIMTVEPGFGGQKPLLGALDKAETLRKSGYRGIISVDGGINRDNAALAVQKGANRLVMGSALFSCPDIKGLIAACHKL